MQSFANVYITSRVRAALHRVLHLQQHKKFWHLVRLLKNGRFEIPGLNVEKLHRSARLEKLYSARLSRDMRVIFSMNTDAAESSITILELNHHDAAYDRADRLGSAQATDTFEQIDDLLTEIEDDKQSLVAEPQADDTSTYAENMQIFKVPEYLLTDPSKYIQFERSLDRYLQLTDEQEEILSIGDQALLVQGPAGTGKTTLALFKALQLFEANPYDSIFLFTYHEELACVCRAYKVNLTGDNEEEIGDGQNPEGIRVLSYLEFIKAYLRREFVKTSTRKNWISKNESIELLQRILAHKNRWERRFRAEEFYGLIYSILKGRFVPGSEALPASKDDYIRIFKNYGRVPSELDEILEIFAIYQNKLDQNKQLDEADIIRLSYDQLKSKARLSNQEQKLWIIIDEVQDFTELEWKSILLFWENQVTSSDIAESYPFVCGDVNQNISRSGFRWQEIEAYLRSIMNNLHRPNALKRIALHKNYRNTQQIHELASFVRRFGSDSTDLGLPAEVPGPVPILSVCEEMQLITALKTLDNTHTSMNPIVVLVEDDHSLNRLRRHLADCPNIFLLSLRNSKGLEFEDVIIYRAFSSAPNNEEPKFTAETARLFDLWYMGICRARRNLMLILQAEDMVKWQALLQHRFEDFLKHVRLLGQENFSLAEFIERRALSVPDYNVIFLERRIAQDLWETFVKAYEAKENTSDNQASSDLTAHGFALSAKDRAINLWQRCLDYSSLGTAYAYLKEYKNAIPVLLRAGLIEEAAKCLFLNEQYDEAAKYYEKSGKFFDAAQSYAAADSFEKAAELYESLTEWKLAAENYQRAGRLSKAAQAWEKSGKHEEAAEIYKSKGNHLAAAESFFQVSDFESAAEMFLLADEKLEAARCLHKSGKYESASTLFIELQKFSEAAKSFELSGAFQKAAKFYAEAGELSNAARMQELQGHFKEAAELYAEAGEEESSAYAFEKSEMPYEAAIAFEKSGNFQKALALAKESFNKVVEARCHERLGDLQNAAECYKESNSLNEAAYCFERLGKLNEAAELYSAAGNLPLAASCMLKLDRKTEAARLYITAGQVSAAFELCLNLHNRQKNNSFLSELIQWCKDNKRTSAEAQLLELNKDFASAAIKYRDCLMLTKAANCLEKSGKILDAAKTYCESGDFEKAADCYKSQKRWNDAAQCLERIQKWSEAKTLYEKSNDKAGIARCTSALNWMP